MQWTLIAVAAVILLGLWVVTRLAEVNDAQDELERRRLARARLERAKREEAKRQQSAGADVWDGADR